MGKGCNPPEEGSDGKGGNSCLFGNGGGGGIANGGKLSSFFFPNKPNIVTPTDTMY